MRKIYFLFTLMFAFLLNTYSATYTVNFESEAKSSYGSADVKLGGPDSIMWNLTDALIAKSSMNNADFMIGEGSLRMRGYTSTAATMLSNKIGGIGTITFEYKVYGSDSQIEWAVDWSSDGNTWTTLGKFTATATQQTFTATVNQPNARIRIIAAGTSSSNKRMNIDNLVITDAGGSPVSAMPTISPNSGNIYGPTEVSISSGAAAADIYYTTDNSSPDNTKTKYTAPFTVNATTTVKAIAYEAGKDPSPIATAVYTLLSSTNISNIAGLRAVALPSTDVYRLTGEVFLTLKSSVRNTKYIQDSSGAIIIDDPQGNIKTTYNLGDGITGILGTLGVYNGMLQFTPVANTAPATSTGNAVAPKVITLAEMVNHQAELVTINNVEITNLETGGNGTFLASKNYPIVGTTTEVLRTAYNDLDYIGSPLPTSPRNITGVVMTFQTTQQIVPRSLADMLATGLFNTQFDSLDLRTSQGRILFNASKGESIEVFNAVGQKIKQRLADEGLNSVSVSYKGVAIVKVGNRVGKVIL